jgi:WD40 repeat protein
VLFLYIEVFAVVTASGSVVLYHRHVTVRAIAKIMAHGGIATSVDWHPRLPNVLATGGSEDRSVKVWTVDLDNGGGAGSGSNGASGAAMLDWTNANTWSSAGTSDSPVTEGHTRYVVCGDLLFPLFPLVRLAADSYPCFSPFSLFVFSLWKLRI